MLYHCNDMDGPQLWSCQLNMCCVYVLQYMQSMHYAALNELHTMLQLNRRGRYLNAWPYR